MTKHLITGTKAIELADMFEDVRLSKYADPIEADRNDLTIAEARKVAAEDPSLIWIDADRLYAEAAQAGDLETCRWIEANAA